MLGGWWVDDLALHPVCDKGDRGVCTCISEHDAWHIVIHILILCMETTIHGAFIVSGLFWFLFSLVTYSK